MTSLGVTDPGYVTINIKRVSVLWKNRKDESMVRKL